MSIATALLRVFNWKVEGGIPEDLKKFVVIVIPHTSAWDFPLGVLARAAIGRDIKFIGKKSLFKPPLGWMMKALGGYPVDRSKRLKFVDQIVEIFNSHDEFAVAIAPEGTRKQVDRLRTGFYYIAKGAGIPIILVKFEYDKRIVHFNPEPFYLTGDFEKDMDYIWEYFKDVQGKIPGFGLPAKTG